MMLRKYSGKVLLFLLFLLDNRVPNRLYDPLIVIR
jgi:hypothetical protein